jgi:hypothetical protein
MFMLVVMFKPDGLVGIWQGAVARLRARRRRADSRAMPAE